MRVNTHVYLLQIDHARAPLGKDDWGDRQSFFSHLQKMHKAREEHVDRVQREFLTKFPAIKGKIGIIGFSPDDIEKIWELRNRLLFVDYNFGQKRWDHPQRLKDLKDLAFEHLSKAISCFKSLEDTLHEKRHDTIVKYS